MGNFCVLVLCFHLVGETQVISLGKQESYQEQEPSYQPMLGILLCTMGQFQAWNFLETDSESLALCDFLS